jgi:3-phytase
MRAGLTVAEVAAALAGCSTTPPITGLPAAPVMARGETEPVGTSNADAADDPALWRNPANPAASLLIGTDKKAGLHVYGLDGKSRFFSPDGLLNNVDLIEMPGQGVIVVASDRNDLANAKLRLYRLDTATARLDPLGIVDGGKGEGYGVCLYLSGGQLFAYSAIKDGTVAEFRIELGTAPRSVPLRSMKLATQIEGCVVDPRNGTLYIGEEDVGIWRFAPGSVQAEKVAGIDNQQLVADVEGLALLPDGAAGGVLVASSQGDNAYTVFSLPGIEPLGRFRIAQGTYGSAEETDGIALAGGNFGPDYPQGLFVAQDGHNGSLAQNFKLVSWADVVAALGLAGR